MMYKEIEILILESLANYCYLTLLQMRLLGINHSNKTMYKVLARLREPSCGLIDRRSFGYHPNFGKLADFHFLKHKGRKYLVNHCGYQNDDIKAPIGNTLFYKDYMHRSRTIYTHIIMQAGFSKLGLTINLFDHYFEGRTKLNSKGRESATKIPLTDKKSIVSDSIAIVLKQGIPYRIFCIEIHNGYDVARIVDQLKEYGKAISTGAPNKKYKVKAGTIVLVIFEYSITLKTTLERLKDDSFFQNLKEHFLFKTIGDIKKDSMSNRLNLKGLLQSLI